MPHGAPFKLNAVMKLQTPLALLSILSAFLVGCGSDSSSSADLFEISSESHSDAQSSSADDKFPEGISSAQSDSSFRDESSSSAEPSVPSSSSAVSWESTPNGIPYLKISTENFASVDTEYTYCSLSLNGNGFYENFAADSVKIRLRGNSTRIYYEKKPYRIKLPSKHSVLGLAANKDWVLLANYRDPTFFMNAVTFDIAREMGNFPFVHSNRFVDVELNGEYVGLYQLTEQIERAKSRVNISADGILLSLDVDDGPDESPNAGNNFHSAVYKMPVAVKYPKSPSAEILDSIRTDFAVLEGLIQDGNYDSVKILLDVQSFIDFILLQEITRNVELAAPRSMYLYKDGGQYHFGPVWDFDGGFGFDWASMTDGHNYFASQTFLFEDPTYKNSIPGFFSDLFRNSAFAADYKSRFEELQANLLNVPFQKLETYATENAAALAKNAERWPTDKDYAEELSHLKSWLSTRMQSYTAEVSVESNFWNNW